MGSLLRTQVSLRILVHTCPNGSFRGLLDKSSKIYELGIQRYVACNHYMMYAVLTMLIEVLSRSRKWRRSNALFKPDLWSTWRRRWKIWSSKITTSHWTLTAVLLLADPILKTRTELRWALFDLPHPLLRHRPSLNHVQQRQSLPLVSAFDIALHYLGRSRTNRTSCRTSTISRFSCTCQDSDTSEHPEAR